MTFSQNFQTKRVFNQILKETFARLLMLLLNVKNVFGNMSLDTVMEKEAKGAMQGVTKEVIQELPRVQILMALVLRISNNLAN